MPILPVALLLVAIVSAVRYPRTRGGARLLVCLVMLVALVGFMFNLVHFAHPGL